MSKDLYIKTISSSSQLYGLVVMVKLLFLTHLVLAVGHTIVVIYSFVNICIET